MRRVEKARRIGKNGKGKPKSPTSDQCNEILTKWNTDPGIQDRYTEPCTIEASTPPWIIWIVLGIALIRNLGKKWNGDSWKYISWVLRKHKRTSRTDLDTSYNYQRVKMGFDTRESMLRLRRVIEDSTNFVKLKSVG